MALDFLRFTKEQFTVPIDISEGLVPSREDGRGRSLGKTGSLGAP